MQNESIDGLSFDGKVVSFGTANENLAIKDIKFEYQNGKLFVIGVVPANATTNDWAKGIRCAIAWDSITEYMIFDSEEQYAELIEKSN